MTTTPNPKSQDTENFSPVGYSMTEPPEDGLWLYKIPGAYIHSPSPKRYAKIEIDEYDLWNYLGAHDQTRLSQVLAAIGPNAIPDNPTAGEDMHQGEVEDIEIRGANIAQDRLRAAVTAIYGSQEKP